MLLIICVERLLHIGSHFSLRKWRQRPHFPTKLAAVASFSYKIGSGGLIFQQNWQQGFGKITGGCSDMVWIIDWILPYWGTLLRKLKTPAHNYTWIP